MSYRRRVLTIAALALLAWVPIILFWAADGGVAETTPPEQNRPLLLDYRDRVLSELYATLGTVSRSTAFANIQISLRNATIITPLVSN